jgi:EmrB/QacA subfamily drug resistance transporter
MENELADTPKGLHTLPRRQVLVTFATLMLGTFISSLDQTVVGTAMPRIIGDLGGFNQYTWITTIYIITSAITIPIVGKLLDMYGRKQFFIGAIALFVLSSALCGLSQSMLQIIIFRGLQGIGGGAMMINSFTVTADLFPPSERGKYQGFMSAVFGFSSIIGPSLGGYITDNLSWHWVFFLNVPLGIIIIALFMKFFPDIRPAHRKHTIDYAGLSTMVLGFACLLLALSWGGIEFPWGSPIIIGMFIFAAVMIAIFVFAESRSVEPIVPMSLFKNRIVAVAAIITFFQGFGMFCGIVFIPLFFQGVLGASATTSGNILIPQMVSMIISSFISGQVLARAGGHYKIHSFIGLGLTGIGIFLLSTMTAGSSYFTAVIYSVIMGLGLGVLMPLFMIAAQNSVPYNLLGVATSTITFSRSIGGSVGLAVLGAALSNRFGEVFLGSLPESVKESVSPEKLTALVNNLQAMVNSGTKSAMESAFQGLGPWASTIMNQVLPVMRSSLATALSTVFLIGTMIVALGIVATFFLKEIPLRKKHLAESSPDRTSGN